MDRISKSTVDSFAENKEFILFLTLLYVVEYATGVCRFRLSDLQDMIVCFGMLSVLGAPMFWVFRIVIRDLAYYSFARGYYATFVGVVLAITILIGLVQLIPMQIGLFCLPLGLIGGIVGSLEAKDMSLERRPSFKLWRR